MSIRRKRSVLCAAVEGVPGTATPPSTATAIAVENAKFTPNIAVNPSPEYNGSFDNNAPYVGLIKGKYSFDVPVKGNSTGAGLSPEWGVLMAACNWQETLFAALVPVGAPEACGAAGGSVTAATLGATAVGTSELYLGCPLTLSGLVVTPAPVIITDYTAAKLATVSDILTGAPDAGTSYQIGKAAVYMPVSPTTQVTLTIDEYVDGVRKRYVGCVGDLDLNCTAGNPWRWSFTFDCYSFSEADVALPAPAYDQTRAAVWKNGVMSIDRIAAGLKSFTLKSGNTVAVTDDPNGPDGIDIPEITARNITGSLDPKKTLVATRDLIGSLKAGTTHLLHARTGSAVGNRAALTVNRALYTGYSETDDQGLVRAGLQFAGTVKDAGAILTIY